MRKIAEIGLSEWLGVLARVGREQNGAGVTARELAAAYGRSAEWVRERVLQPAVAGGLVELGTRTIMRIDGRPTPIVVYRLIAKGGRK